VGIPAGAVYARCKFLGCENLKVTVRKPPLTVIGPMFAPRRSNVPDGRRVSFMILLAELDRLGLQYEAVNSNRYNHLPKIGRLLSALWLMANAGRLGNGEIVSFNGAGAGVASIGGRLLRYTRQQGTQLSVRVFGGAFKHYYISASSRERGRIEGVLQNLRAVFFETLEQVEFFKSFCPNTYWFPNNRPASPPGGIHAGGYTKKLVFVGHVKPDKGAYQVIELAQRLGPSYQVDVFGPLMDGVTSRDFVGKQARYRGILSPDRVAPTVAKYDALLLPTSYSGEGEPGVIIEALSVGVPSIATRVAGIPEVLVDGETGFLVAPGSVEDLVSAVRRCEHQEPHAVRERCLRQFTSFDSAKQTELFLKRLGAL